MDKWTKANSVTVEEAVFLQTVPVHLSGNLGTLLTVNSVCADRVIDFKFSEWRGIVI
jgi:hypothetical protein